MHLNIVLAIPKKLPRQGGTNWAYQAADLKKWFPSRQRLRQALHVEQGKRHMQRDVNGGD